MVDFTDHAVQAGACHFWHAHSRSVDTAGMEPAATWHVCGTASSRAGVIAPSHPVMAGCRHGITAARPWDSQLGSIVVYTTWDSSKD